MQDYTILVINMLLHDANREQCNAVIESASGDVRAHATARLNVLDGIQKKAVATVYRETPPRMVDSDAIQDWWIEKYGLYNIHHIDFRAIANGKRQERYAFANEIVENNL